MDAVEFITQCRRMFAKNCITKGIKDFSTPPEEVAEVAKWAEEHRPKTRQEKFLEQFPKAKVFADGILKLCPENLEGTCQYKANTQDTGYHCDKYRKKYWLEEVE